MAIKMDGNVITELELHASDGTTTTKQLTEDINLQQKTATVNGDVTPDTGYDGLSKVVVNVPAPEINLQNKTATANGEVTADEGYDGLGVVTVAVSGDAPTYQEKTVTENGVVLPDAGYDALSKVTVNVSGGGDVLIESGEIALHTGVNEYTINIPVSDDTKAHYCVMLKAKNFWRDGVEREGLDFSEFSSAGTVLCIAATAFYPKIETNSTKHDETVTEGLERNDMLYARTTVNTGAISWSKASSHTITVADGVLSLTNPDVAFCRYGAGLTHEYTVIGWD